MAVNKEYERERERIRRSYDKSDADRGQYTGLDPELLRESEANATRIQERRDLEKSVWELPKHDDEWKPGASAPVRDYSGSGSSSSSFFMIIAIVVGVPLLYWLCSHISDKRRERAQFVGDIDAPRLFAAVMLKDVDKGQIVGFIKSGLVKDSLDQVMKAARNSDGSYDIQKFPAKWYDFKDQIHPSRVFIDVILYKKRNWLGNDEHFTDSSHFKFIASEKKKNFSGLIYKLTD